MTVGTDEKLATKGFMYIKPCRQNGSSAHRSLEGGGGGLGPKELRSVPCMYSASSVETQVLSRAVIIFVDLGEDFSRTNSERIWDTFNIRVLKKRKKKSPVSFIVN